MAINDCIDAAIRQGHITADEGETLKKRYAELSKQAPTSAEAKSQLIGEMEAEAAERKRRALLSEQVRQKLVTALKGYRNAYGQADLAEAFVKLHENFGREGTYLQDAESHKAAIQRQAQAKLTDLLMEFRRGALTGDLRRTMPKVKARLDLVVKELHGEASADPAIKALADAFRDVAEDLRLRFNAAGGAVGKLENWFPHSHDQQALLDYGRGAWIDYMMQPDVLDRERMAHPLHKRAMTDAELRESLGVVWDRITTDGWIDREVAGVPMGRGALWSQHADHRFLHFKNADAWLKYADNFGNRDPFAAMMSHIATMSRDIAQMEVFGPNPNTMRTYLRNWLSQQVALIKPTEVMVREQTAKLADLAASLSKPNPEFRSLIDRIGQIHIEMDKLRRTYKPQLGGKPRPDVQAGLDAFRAELVDLEQKLVPYWSDPSLQAIEDQGVRLQMDALLTEMRDPIVFASHSRPADYLGAQLDRADAMWELMRGSLSPVSAGFANVMQSARNIISASSLGAAWLSSLSDPAFGQDARLRFGMGMARSQFTRILPLVLKDMVAGMNEKEAVRASLGLDSALDVMHRKARQNKTVDGRAWTGYLADRVLTVGLLSPWTQAGKHLFGLDVMAFLADQSETPFAKLPTQTQRALDRHGFDAAAWDAIRVAPKHEPKQGAFYLRAAEIEATAGRELAERYVAMILRETKQAVPEATTTSRSVLGRTRPGTTLGEVMRSAGQFKGFGIAVAQLKVIPLARELMAGDRSAAGYAAVLLITSSFLGAIAMALKDIKDGRDPRKWLDEKTYLDPAFWGAAALQAGGLGIYGDFLFSNTGRHGQSLASALAGPMVDRLDNLLALTTGNMAQGIRGERTNTGREAVRFAKMNTPGGNLWYVGLIYQRVLMDQLQRLVDPEAHQAFARQIQVRRKDYKQEFWWPPGSPSPKRAPDVSRVLSTR